MKNIHKRSKRNVVDGCLETHRLRNLKEQQETDSDIEKGEDRSDNYSLKLGLCGRKRDVV